MKYFVGKPEIPNWNIVAPKMAKIWKSQQLTNFGETHEQLEAALIEYFECENVILFNNGTAALEALLTVLNKKIIITSPYSFKATTTSILRAGSKPKFLDVEISDGNLSSSNVCQSNLKSSEIILPTHVYGFPCAVDDFEALTNGKNIDMVYDAAHTFGCKFGNAHLAVNGIASILSFHATKIYTTIEGGAVLTRSSTLSRELKKFRNFGFDEYKNPATNLATNAKMSEVHAAVGLEQLKNIKSVIEKRRALFFKYYSRLVKIEKLQLFVPIGDDEAINGSYLPIIVKEGSNTRKSLQAFLQNYGIGTKPYFDTNLATIYTPEYSQNHPNTDFLVDRVLCLPIHSEMTNMDVNFIVNKVYEFFEERGN